MKHYSPWIAALICCITILTSPVFGQRKPVSYTVTAYKALENPYGWKDLPIDVTVMVKDSQRNVIYTETHRDTLNKICEAKIDIGKGANQSPMYDKAPMDKAKWLCNTVTVKDPTGDVTIMTEDQFNQNLFSHFSENAGAVGNVAWTDNSVPPMDLFMPGQGTAYSIPVTRSGQDPEGKKTFNQLLMANYMVAGNKPSAVNDMPVDYLHIGTGMPCPIVFGQSSVNFLESFYEISPGPATNMAKFWNAFGSKIYYAGTPIGHTTSAIYGENLDPQGSAFYGNGYLYGGFFAGNTGVFASNKNFDGNTASVWGNTSFPAPTGSGSYSILGTSNNHANALAGYFVGNTHTTGMATEGSDQFLKTNIQTSAFGLSTLLKLRPTTYEFVANSIYSLPKGEQLGFIAQEVEEVIPSVVADIVVPKSLDPEEMATSGTTTVKGIRYTGLIPVLTTAIQELNAKVDALAAEVERLNKALEAASKEK